MRIFAITIILFLQACSANKYLPINDINYSDGVNKNEAESLANNYIKNSGKRFCHNVYIFGLKDGGDNWKVELGCDSSIGVLSIPYNNEMHRHRVSTIIRDGGFLLVDKINGKVTQTYNK